MTAEVLLRLNDAAERWQTGGGKDARPQTIFGSAAGGSHAMKSEATDIGQARAPRLLLRMPNDGGMFEHAEQRRGSSLSDFYECNSEGVTFLAALTLLPMFSVCKQSAEGLTANVATWLPPIPA